MKKKLQPTKIHWHKSRRALKPIWTISHERP